MRKVGIQILGCLVLALVAAGVQAKQWEVDVGGTSTSGDGYGGSMTTAVLNFSPATLTINAGDSIVFKNLGGAPHNVHADDNSFRCAQGCDGDTGGNGNPSSANWSFTRTFNTAGTIHYHCDEHQAMGMVGSIVVNAVTQSFSVGGYMSGNWYNPQQSGHGFQLEFTNNNHAVGAIWFVYTPDGNTGADGFDGQNWIFSQGTFDPSSNTVTLPAVLLNGPTFPTQASPYDSTKLKNTSWGTLTFTFTDCNNGTVAWNSTLPQYGTGSMAIQRLTQIAGTTCPQQ